MIIELYADISIVLCSLLIVLGLYILFLASPKNPALQNYHIARRALAYAYLFFGTINLLEYFSHSEKMDISLMQLITLVVGCSQAFLFTYSLITLINSHFVTRQRIIKESIPILLFSIVAFILYALTTYNVFRIYLYILAVFYIYLMMRFTRMFLIHYREYLQKINHFFSDDEPKRLQWVYFSFFCKPMHGYSGIINVANYVAFRIIPIFRIYHFILCLVLHSFFELCFPIFCYRNCCDSRT